MSLQAQFVDTVERFHDIDAESLANQQMYNVVSGCAPSYSASTMVITVASGVILHNGVNVTVAGNTVTAVQSGTSGQSRWAIVGIDSSGVAQIAHGDAAANTALDPSLKPEFASDQVYVAALLIPQGLTIVDSATQKIDKRIPGPASLVTTKIKTAAQDFSATTTYADITATSGNFAVTVAANRKYRIKVRLYLSALGTAASGGLKLQLTGPAAPTFVFAVGQAPWTFVAGGSDYPAHKYLSYATAFSANIFSQPNFNTTAASGFSAGGTVPMVAEVEAVIWIGSTAGTVTLQGAQNTGAGTTTVTSGDFVAEDIT